MWERLYIISQQESAKWNCNKMCFHMLELQSSKDIFGTNARFWLKSGEKPLENLVNSCQWEWNRFFLSIFQPRKVSKQCVYLVMFKRGKHSYLLKSFLYGKNSQNPFFHFFSVNNTLQSPRGTILCNRTLLLFSLTTM
jgi:hypothetical protein